MYILIHIITISFITDFLLKKYIKDRQLCLLRIFGIEQALQYLILINRTNSFIKNPNMHHLSLCFLHQIRLRKFDLLKKKK